MSHITLSWSSARREDIEIEKMTQEDVLRASKLLQTEVDVEARADTDDKSEKGLIRAVPGESA